MTPADKLAYAQLISAAADHVGQPVCGKPSIEQLPRLKPEDIELITRCSPVDVTDQLDITEHFAAFCADIAAKDFCQLGARMALILERACRATIAYDVMCELEAREVAEDLERDTGRYLRGQSLEA